MTLVEVQNGQPMPPRDIRQPFKSEPDDSVASAREKSIRHGHPSTLHLWWARRPLPVR